MLWVVNILFDGKLHGFHYKVRAVWNANSIVVGKEVVGIFLAKCACNVAGDDSWIAVGIPRGCSLVGSSGSLWRQNR